MHSVYSDGEASLIDLMMKTEALSLSYISITDHNTMKAYEELQNKDIRNIFKGKIIPAVELTFQYQGLSMDLLAYGISGDELGELLIDEDDHFIIVREQERLTKMKSVCDELSLSYDSDLKIKYKNERANDVICDHLLSNLQNKETLEKLGIYNRTTFYRDHYLNPSSKFYLEEENQAPTLQNVVEAVHRSNGICFLAHPFVYHIDDVHALVDNLMKLNLFDGIECIHRRHQKAQSEWLIEYCDRHHLLKSGGSDYHKDTHSLGYGDQGTIPIEESLSLDWLTTLKPI